MFSSLLFTLLFSLSNSYADAKSCLNEKDAWTVAYSLHPIEFANDPYGDELTQNSVDKSVFVLLFACHDLLGREYEGACNTGFSYKIIIRKKDCKEISFEQWPDHFGDGF